MKITKTWFKKEIEISTDEINDFYEKIHPNMQLYTWILDILNDFLPPYNRK